jgi:hypothetical protein
MCVDINRKRKDKKKKDYDVLGAWECVTRIMLFAV